MFAAATAAATFGTFAARARRARSRKPLTQTLTVLAPPDRVRELLERSGAASAIEIREAPGGRGTEMQLSMRARSKYDVKDALREVKAIIEAGETPTGRRSA